MAKTSNVYIRLDPRVKEQSETILNQLGIPMSNAIALFLQQVILQNGIPFELKLPESKPVAYGALSDEQFNRIIENGIAEYAAGRIVSAQNVREQIKREFGA
ncbi:MAG: type II toxin-antitoxin system RelB/DinJ family antitoxin [Clostridiales bacterium]|nr:type II toxin-antitoxin system RelB/DinJ family antitoxin [Clostridiales bacterium]